MEILDFRCQQIEDGNRIFPPEVYESPWVIFHGTTNVSASRIETDGFLWNGALYDKKDVEEVVSIFQKMDWVGLGADAYSALSTFTLSKDFAESEIKPIFFSELPGATIGYTKERRVAGETAGCLAYAISNLRAFLEDASLRAEFRARRYARLLDVVHGIEVPQGFSNLTPENATASDCRNLANYLDDLVGRQCVFPRLTQYQDAHTVYEPWEEDLEWLSAKLRSLAPLHDRLLSLSKGYDHGVIYAVEFNENDVSSMKDLSNGMHHGIAYHGRLSPDRIIAKTMISKDQKGLTISPSSHGVLVRLKNGITGALMPLDEKISKIAILEAFSR